MRWRQGRGWEGGFVTGESGDERTRADTAVATGRDGPGRGVTGAARRAALGDWETRRDQATTHSTKIMAGDRLLVPGSGRHEPDTISDATSMGSASFAFFFGEQPGVLGNDELDDDDRVVVIWPNVRQTV